MEKMKNFNTFHFLFLDLTFFFLFFSPTIIIQAVPTSYCGKIKIQKPFSLHNYNEPSSILSQVLLCKSQNLYFRTSIGLFPLSSIDYDSKTLTISHFSSCSSASQKFISPNLLTAGFPSLTDKPNSLLLFNCLKQSKPMSLLSHNCTKLYGCEKMSTSLESSSSCWLIDDSEKLEIGFDPKDFNCSHYSRIYKDSSFGEKYELGTRVSFDIPDHVPNICDECRKQNGSCGVGLKCVCYPKQCRDRVLTGGVSRALSVNFVCYSAFFTNILFGLFH
ncbi:hypothetical protein MKW98_002279 [Papaver atlanticum]|uniref:Wall-associated receptor kinase C-terminal domain-containing protein n=1 Tax=Papaver atlanticum TaxID=357466 RepID=A0AAD4RUP2_9MAGN|nr:hypothetical protein MKW98_002279 [Papaver atlanticum]